MGIDKVYSDADFVAWVKDNEGWLRNYTAFKAS